MKRYSLKFSSGRRVETDDNGIERWCPTADEELVRALETGETHVDDDGDTWERVE